MELDHPERLARSFRTYTLWFMSAAVVIVLCLLATPLIVGWWTGPIPRSDRGAFGDQFGITNALFAGLAFAGVIVAIVMQADELRLQRLELEETQQIMAGQREQLAIQANAMAKQVFESTFFQLLGLHNQIVDAVEVIEMVKPATGRRAFKPMTAQLTRILRDVEMLGRGDGPGQLPRAENPAEDRLGVIDEAYGEFYREHGDSVGHYFRNLYHICRFIDQSKTDDPKAYIRVVRAQLSESELVMLFYNCCSSAHGRDKFMPLANRYNLFDNLRVSALVNPLDRQLTESSMVV